MENNINKIDLIAPGLIVKKRKSPLFPILVSLAGLAVTLSRHFIPAVGADPDLASGVLIVGWTVMLSGAAWLLMGLLGQNSFDYYYKPTGEKLKKYELPYEVTHRERVCDCIRSGNFGKLALLPTSAISSLKVTLYTVGEKEIKWAQVFEFVPHTHVPITAVCAYEQCAIPRELALR